MGLQEFLKKQWRMITGKDPETEVGGLYKMESTGTGLPTDGNVYHKVLAHSPVQTPPGVEWYKDANGKMAWKWARNTSGRLEVDVAYWAGSGSSTQLRHAGASPLPFGSTGTALVSATSLVDEWKPFYAAGTLVAGTIDITIKAAAAGEQVEAILLSVSTIPSDQATNVITTLDWEDDDASAPAAGSSFQYQYVHDVTNTWSQGSPAVTLPHHACWGLGNNAQGLQLEVTQVGGGGNEPVVVGGIYRVH